MKKYLVIGNPIEHSLSPKLHNYWIQKNNIDAIYTKKQLNESDIEAMIDEVKSENIREKILKNSPSDNKDFFVVPKVVE